jgi:5-methylcytosine-specific restriction enzyme A
MASELTKEQWVDILLNSEITKEIDLAMFQAIYSFDGHKAYASQVGILLGYEGKSPHAPLNSEVGLYAKRIAKLYDIEFTKRNEQKYKFWDIFFNGWEEGRYFIWELKSPLIEALKETKLTGEQPYPEEIETAESDEQLSEGLKKTVTVNTYERNSRARHLCIKHWGTKCSACGFDFESIYGNLGSGYIHVHHLIPVSQIGKSYKIDPVNDLRPICPNCHAMVHAKNPPLSISELQEIMESVNVTHLQ